MLRIDSLTDIGLVRSQNEDSFAIRTNKLGHHMILVADGMGGHNAGNIASQMAAKIIADNFEVISRNIDYKVFIEKVSKLANHEIYKAAMLNPEYAKMGTTLSFAIFDFEKMYTGHVGDSRIYFINSKRIKQITRDHTVIQEMMDNGSMTEQEASASPLKNVLLQALGTSKKLSIEIKEIKLPPRFKILICSDGLSSFVNDSELQEIITKNISIEQRLEELIELAKIKDGSDNITAILMEEQ